MAKHCEKCGKELDWVGSGPEWMNSYQWDAVKAGDYYVECENPTHPNGNCYFWKRDSGEIVRAVAASPTDAQTVKGEETE